MNWDGQTADVTNSEYEELCRQAKREGWHIQTVHVKPNQSGYRVLINKPKKVEPQQQKELF